MIRRLSLALATIAALSLAACTSATAPAATADSHVATHTTTSSVHPACGGVQAGQGGC
jgi:hypothetical protein